MINETFTIDGFKETFWVGGTIGGDIVIYKGEWSVGWMTYKGMFSWVANVFGQVVEGETIYKAVAEAAIVAQRVYEAVTA